MANSELVFIGLFLSQAPRRIGFGTFYFSHRSVCDHPPVGDEHPPVCGDKHRVLDMNVDCSRPVCGDEYTKVINMTLLFCSFINIDL